MPPDLPEPVPGKGPEELLREATEYAAHLRMNLTKSLIPAEISPTAKAPFKIVVLRELLLHRLSDLSDAACAMYGVGSVVPAIVLTRAAFETMALLFHLNKTIDRALREADAAVVDDRAMTGLLGSKDGSTNLPALNVMTAVEKLDKDYQGLKEMFETLCEFAHPNYHGLASSYQTITAANLDDPHVPVALGAVNPGPRAALGLLCLVTAIPLGRWFADDLATRDEELARLCESAL